MPWTTEQKIFIVEAYFRQKSIHAAQLQFKERFWCRAFPVHSMIYRWVNKFRTHGTVHNLNRKDTSRQSHYGRPKSSRTPHNVSAVRLCCLQPKQVYASAICPGAWQVLDSTWSTERVRQGPSVVPAGWCHPHTSNESLVWLQQRFPDRLTGLEPPRFLSVGIP